MQPPSPPPPPGWYPSPERPGHLQFWNGSAWTSDLHSTAIPQPAAVAPPAGAPVSAWAAGLAAAVPLVTVLLAVAGGAYGPTAASALGVITTTTVIVFAGLDVSALRRAGRVGPGFMLWILTMWLYFIPRVFVVRTGWSVALSLAGLISGLLTLGFIGQIQTFQP
ncbi:DUF2510 domain-containing protein [Nocardioides sp. TRM66260-LWL]|uniref:DUF2510 domain-containing protein n=1 Tax=Nocardioides sp. TRM66260-LWL TaxID=2874478 RepID=UPI001CC360D9|nr:DUF2510 domain-containing protein [Nocardioides sp. TRM66260-LWL]MBZ5736516.1 DUF2510 domain-containing protein [Nocardioides sp. TRM66260-LWL]